VAAGKKLMLNNTSDGTHSETVNSNPKWRGMCFLIILLIKRGYRIGHLSPLFFITQITPRLLIKNSKENV